MIEKVPETIEQCRAERKRLKPDLLEDPDEELDYVSEEEEEGIRMSPEDDKERQDLREMFDRLGPEGLKEALEQIARQPQPEPTGSDYGN